MRRIRFLGYSRGRCGGKRPCRRARDRKRGLRPCGRRLGGAGRSARRTRCEGRRPVVQLGQGPGRHPGRLRGRRLSRAARARRLDELARDRRHGARGGADLGSALGDSLARGARRRVHARERLLPARALRRRVGEAAAPGRRPHGTRDHRRAPRRRRGEHGEGDPEIPAPVAGAHRERLAGPLPPAR